MTTSKVITLRHSLSGINISQTHRWCFSPDTYIIDRSDKRWGKGNSWFKINAGSGDRVIIQKDNGSDEVPRNEQRAPGFHSIIRTYYFPYKFDMRLGNECVNKEE